MAAGRFRRSEAGGPPADCPHRMSNLYNQTRDESAAILKLVIAELGRHDAPFTPAAFSVWYEHFAGINPGLSQAVELRRQARPRLSGEAMNELYRLHVADLDAEATKAASGQFGRVLTAVAQQAETTGRDAKDYGHQLAGLRQALQDGGAGVGQGTTAPQLSEVASGTERMQTSVAALARAVDEGKAEIERLHQALDRSRTEAITDPLSQLLNRKGFDDAMQRMLARPARSGRVHCLLMLDIDHFKRVNDTYGHPVGDTVIQVLGQVLQRTTTGPGLSAARVGGEEFAVLMADSTVALATQLAQAVQSLVRSTTIRKRGSQETIASVTISAGVAALRGGEDAAALIASADQALYKSKQNGRDRVTVA
jgi:diguanylate cyclase